jgi:hypothetical protein
MCDGLCVPPPRRFGQLPGSVLVATFARTGLRSPATLADRPKLRRLEIAAGAPVRQGKPSGVWVTHEKMRQAERALAEQAQASYERMVRDWQAASPKKEPGASVTVEHA